ncbi:MAG: twin-arginine translocase subunit TatC [Verrucomicrobiota bacterium]
MYLLKKAIQLRESSHPDHEKPFLEHLEDLRTMVTRIVVTLLISMIVCFAFNKKFMAFFRQPVDQVLVAQIEKTLPTDAARPVTVESWGKARKVEHAATALSPEQREIFYRSLADDSLVFHAKSVSLYRATVLLPEEKREAFVNSLPETDDTKLQVKALLRTKPNADSDINGNLKMMSALKPTEGFMLSMKLSFVAGIVVSFPLLLLFILQFVLPGLHNHEKRVLWPAMAVGFGLFLTGASFAYYLVLPRALLFFAEWSGDMGISNDWRIGEYISFATQFTLLFGASFELPVVVMVFVKLGMLSYETMSRTRSYAIVAIFVAAAVLTPTPDMMTMALMASPMIILYEICIWLAYLDRKKARIREEQEARESMERQLLREEKMRAAEAADPDWQANHPETDHHAAEAGDDGWHDEYPQHDPHASDVLPELDEEPPAKIPEDGERRRMDP